MIIEILTLEDALEFCDALHVPEQVAVQYSDYDENDIYETLLINQLKPNSYLVKKYIEEFKLDLNEVLSSAASIGFTDVVKFLLADSRVDSSAEDNEAFRLAVNNGHLEILKLLLADSRVDPSAEDNLAFRFAATKGHVEILKLLLSDSRVDPSAKRLIRRSIRNHLPSLGSTTIQVDIV